MGKAEILRFGNVGYRDVYNPTAPFADNGITYIAARTESREVETDSQVWFFKEENDGVWYHDPVLPTFPLQDPFVTRVKGELVFGGVRFPVGNRSWKTDFYRGKDISDLEKFAEGPLGMKDIRIIELPNGEVGVFTRPMGEIGGRGTIGFMTINSLDLLGNADLMSADLLRGQFAEEEWGGVNAAYVLNDKELGVLGHFAHFSEDENGNLLKHYYAMVFKFNYLTRKASPIKIIAKRKDFPLGEAKRSPELDDVVLSGGFVFLGDGNVELYVGLSDARVGKIVMKNPFLE
ncbi:DUF1861 family protein [candidate division WOR-3 bacterium]|nr:DUF1861 family protein [candidate division WOR-3 bacterium]